MAATTQVQILVWTGSIPGVCWYVISHRRWLHFRQRQLCGRRTLVPEEVCGRRRIRMGDLCSCAGPPENPVAADVLCTGQWWI